MDKIKNIITQVKKRLEELRDSSNGRRAKKWLDKGI